MRRIVISILSVLMFFSTASMLLWPGQYWREWQVMASTAFVLVGLAAAGWRTWYGRIILAGLVCCWFGDYIGGGGHFLPSVAAFLLGHIAYIAAFATTRPVWKHAAVGLAIMVPVSAVLGYWVLSHVPAHDFGLVAAYLVMITTMVVMAFGAATRNTLILVAAVIFFISDIFVARWKYITPHDRLNAFGCYPLYYTACLLFATSILTPRGKVPADQNPSLTTL